MTSCTAISHPLQDTVPASAGELRILSLSCVFPNPADPAYGIFVQRRLQAVAADAHVRVLAPVPLFDYARRGQPRQAGIPRLALDRGLAVWHPRWFYPPMGGAFNTVCLALQLLLPLARLRRRWRFDVLDAHFGFPDGIAAALLSLALRVPFAVTLRGNEVWHAGHPLQRMLLGWALRRAGQVIAVSERLKEFALAMGVPAARIDVIPNGIDGGVFYPRDRALCRRKHGIPEDAWVVLSAGSLIERKGHHLVAKAVARLRQTGLPVHLVLAGGAGREGDYASEIRSIAVGALHGALHMPGAVSPDTLAELMSAADVLCLASSREGWPNVVHEALACGTPVVSTDVGAVPDMLPSPRYGIVVPTREPAGIEDGLRQALSREWDRSAIADWGGARSWERVGAETLSRLTRLARRAAGERKSK
jgi:teichuronic acid biosynthesis glycosyltransferase TuaC